LQTHEILRRPAGAIGKERASTSKASPSDTPRKAEAASSGRKTPARTRLLLSEKAKLLTPLAREGVAGSRLSEGSCKSPQSGAFFQSTCVKAEMSEVELWSTSREAERTDRGGFVTRAGKTRLG
jgi:hypothetical protein